MSGRDIFYLIIQKKMLSSAYSGEIYMNGDTELSVLSACAFVPSPTHMTSEDP